MLCVEMLERSMFSVDMVSDVKNGFHLVRVSFISFPEGLRPLKEQEWQ